jgi:putative ABC transport system ATP-binding protein
LLKEQVPVSHRQGADYNGQKGGRFIAFEAPMSLILLDDVWKIYQIDEMTVEALRGVSLSIEQGEYVALMGPSGSGKSTLMNTLGCLDRPTKGSYLLDGIEVATMPTDARANLRNRKIGFVFQNFNLLARTSALENTELPMLYARPGISGREQRKRAEEMLALVGLGDRSEHYPSQLSGGQQQRVAIARALVNQPKLLLADEPTGNLDSRTSVEIMGVFQRLNQQGITVLMVTHELDIARYSLRSVVMRDGRIVSDQRQTQRLDAETELKRIDLEHQAVQLAP